MSVDEMIRILNKQIKERQEIIETLEKNRYLSCSCSCGLTPYQITNLVDWVHCKEAKK